MTALATLTRYRTKSYDAFRVTDLGRTYPALIDPVDTLEEALNLAVVGCHHKDRLVIKEVDEDRTTLHIYAIKQRSKPNYTYRNHALHRQHRLYAELICPIDGNALGLRGPGHSRLPQDNNDGRRDSRTGDVR